jgi:hypothetical protein
MTLLTSKVPTNSLSRKNTVGENPSIFTVLKGDDRNKKKKN